MTTQDLLIHVIARKSKRAGFISIYLRVKVQGTKSEISTKISIPQSNWDKTKQKVKGNDQEALQLNRNIELLKAKVYNIFDKLRINDEEVSAQKIKSIVLDGGPKKRSLLELLDYHIEKESSKLAEGTIKNHKATRRRVGEFIKKNFHRKDLYLSELNYHFIYEFEMFLRTRNPDPGYKPAQNNTVMKHLQRLGKAFKLGNKLGWLKEDPLEHFEFNFEFKERDFLDEDELESVMQYSPAESKLQKTRDIFVFMCYTGIGYADLSELTYNELVRGIDGRLWLIDQRKKSKKSYYVPLLDPALEILEKYKETQIKRLLPVTSIQKINENLKTIAQELNITKNLTSYVARHTFATTVTLNNDVPIESVSKMLGHTKISTTQIYSRVLEKKVSQDMNQLRKKLDNKNSNDSKNNAM